MSISITMRSVPWRALPMASSLGALGVVFGDIGTSPLYALREAVKAASASGAPSAQSTISVVSLIIWSLILIISLKYAILIMRADNRGEGGIVALLAILRARHARARTWRSAVLVVGLLGAALLYGDGAITPAISVLSALEGLKVDAPALAPVVVPLTVLVLIALFMVQRRGTAFIGGIFERGQIYVPIVNWTLAVATLAAVIGFGTSDNLAGAYGIAVSALMAITTFLAALVAMQWGFNLVLVLAANSAFLLVDLIFFTANSMKLFEGGWFPLLITAAIAFIMLTWRRGQRISDKARSKLRESEPEFMRKLAEHPPVRLPGTSAFLSSATRGVPLTLTHQLRHMYALHEQVLIVTVLTTEERVPEEARVEIQELACGFTRVILRFGVTESPSVPEGVRYAHENAELSCDQLSHVSYYIGRETIIPTAHIPGMWVWRETLYAFMQRNAERSAAYFCIPAAQVVEIGIEIEI